MIPKHRITLFFVTVVLWWRGLRRINSVGTPGFVEILSFINNFFISLITYVHYLHVDYVNWSSRSGSRYDERRVAK